MTRIECKPQLLAHGLWKRTPPHSIVWDALGHFSRLVREAARERKARERVGT